MLLIFPSRFPSVQHLTELQLPITTMVIFKSQQPDISVPHHLPIWTWLFDSEYSPLRKHDSKDIKGYTNAATKEHLSYADIKVHSTHLSTALVKNYGLKEGETVSLFAPNTVWYPVAMFGTLRAGGVVSGASPAYGELGCDRDTVRCGGLC